MPKSLNEVTGKALAAGGYGVRVCVESISRSLKEQYSRYIEEKYERLCGSLAYTERMPVAFKRRERVVSPLFYGNGM